MIKFDHSEKINAPVERVFQYATDPDTAAEWQDGVMESSKTPAGEMRMGSTMKTTRMMMGQRMESTAEVTEYTPNQAYALKTTGGPVKFSMRQTFTPDGGGTRVDTHIEMEPGTAMQISEPMIAGSLSEQIEKNSKKLKEIMES